MKEIDFTPAWYTQSLAERRGARHRVAGLALVAVLVLLWSYQSARQTRAAAQTLHQLQQSYDAQAGMVARLDALEQAGTRHAQNAHLLADVSGGITAGTILAELSHLMPRALSIRTLYLQRAPRISFSAPGEDEGSAAQQDLAATTLEITGWAASGMEIGSFVSRLAASELFYDVTLKYERPERAYGRRVIEFQLVCRMPEFK